MFQVKVVVSTYMRKTLVVYLCLILTCSVIPNTAALPAVETNAGPIFGSQWAYADNSTTKTDQIEELPIVVEDYTATWCTNCVKVADTLAELEDEGLIHKYAFHRAPDHEDPLGDEAANGYYDERYETGLPPIVVFGGTHKKEGSAPESDSLKQDYQNLIANPSTIGEGTTYFSWVSGADCECGIAENSGTITWNLEAELSYYSNATLSVHAWIVESYADYADGGNGKGTYPDVVRKIIDLGNDKNGTATIVLPEPFDGDDLEVHLMYVLNLPQTEVVDNDKDSDDEKTPGFMLASAMLAVAIAAVVRSNRYQD